MSQWRYHGPSDRLRIDDVVLVRDGPPGKLSADQVRRVRQIGGRHRLTAVKPAKQRAPQAGKDGAA